MGMMGVFLILQGRIRGVVGMHELMNKMSFNGGMLYEV